MDHLILGQRLNLCYIAEVIAMKAAGKPPVLRLSSTDVDVSIGYIPKRLLPALEEKFSVFADLHNLFDVMVACAIMKRGGAGDWLAAGTLEGEALVVPATLAEALEVACGSLALLSRGAGLQGSCPAPVR